MHDFHFKNKELYCENIPVADIAQAVGTPFYLYSHKTLLDHFLKIQTAFAAVDPVICFAMKANGNLAVLKALVKAGAGLDIVSGGELKKAWKIQADPQKIVYASVGKTDEEILAALKTGILFFNVESSAELERINHIAEKGGMTAPVAIRINPDVEATTHEFITTGTLKNKFGIDLTSAKQLLKESGKQAHIRIIGLHIHIGSQIVDSAPFIKAITRVTEFIEELKTEGVTIEYLDIGGGLGIIYKDEKPQTAQEFAEAVLPCLKKSGLKIIMEPGRFIAGNAGILVTKVLYFKDNGYKKFLIVDGGMNDLIRPSFYGAYHEIVPVQETPGPAVQLDVVGPICESGDFLGKARQLPVLPPGALLAVMSAGAYGFAMSSNYNARCRVPEVMVSGNQYAVVRERETFEDLIRGEKIPEFL
ncbi:MAG: diaminopimelate decarboxylase [Candidatus Omnitrophica bacterium]|nr:diaminopimelate decarboxylase [Candidatus Omnitrophota bacterium]HPB68025.1 diaminopimelate decarboxylase [Candidatus Omnitrophota bacterium]